MQTVVTELYGIVGMFFTTNVRYELPRVSYRDYPADSSSESSSSEDDDKIVEGQPEHSVRAGAYAGGGVKRQNARERNSKKTIASRERCRF